ncbi:MAG: VCBS repeat-containing protein [Candidatus Latescibacterota bacterium]
MDQQPRLVPQVHDLNRDGLFDPLFVDVNYRQGPYLRVLRGQRGDLPVEEGSYPLPAEPRGWAVGDLDGDKAPDVVVVVEGIDGAGVYVLHNGADTAGAVDLARAE